MGEYCTQGAAVRSYTVNWKGTQYFLQCICFQARIGKTVQIRAWNGIIVQENTCVAALVMSSGVFVSFHVFAESKPRRQTYLCSIYKVDLLIWIGLIKYKI